MDQLKGRNITAEYDNDDKSRVGFKFAEHELRGIPIRIGMGMRDLNQNQVEIARRDTKEKTFVPLDDLADYIKNLLEEIQDNLFQKALDFRDRHTTYVDTIEDFESVLETKGGFIYAHWDGSAETEEEIKNRTKATIRCIPLDAPEEEGVDLISGKPSKRRVVFAKAY